MDTAPNWRGSLTKYLLGYLLVAAGFTALMCWTSERDPDARGAYLVGYALILGGISWLALWFHAALRHLFPGRSAYLTVAAWLLLTCVPRLGRGYVEGLGWPLQWLNLDPIHFEANYTPQEVRFYIEDMWQKGKIGPNGAAGGGWGWHYFRLSYGRVLSVCAYQIAGHGILAWAAVLTARRVHYAWLVRHDPRFKPGHCRSCGYDLTGNLSGVCPECGAAVPVAA